MPMGPNPPTSPCIVPYGLCEAATGIGTDPFGSMFILDPFTGLCNESIEFLG